jgi:predicted nucleic acid-binding protein
VITAIDTNVVLDVLGGDPAFGRASLRAVADAQGIGAVMACDVVWSEVGAWFADPADAHATLSQMGIRFAALDPEVAMAAGRTWWNARRGRSSRERILPDFLIGTHAWMRADRLLTRDRGFYRAYFKRLKIVDPSSR